MRIGVVLPTFRDDVDDAVAVARQCDELGLDGVFAYDHLWPMGSPTRPALAPFAVLATVATRTSHLSVGPLVARVGLVGADHLVSQFRSLASLAPGRVIAALGTGDLKSRDELEGFGLTLASAGERRAQLGAVVAALREEMPVWIGAGREATNALAVGAVTLNLWDADAAAVAASTRRSKVSWAGPARDDLMTWLDELEVAGATWAVFTPGVDLAVLSGWRHGARVSKFR